MLILDAGHKYKLTQLDKIADTPAQFLTFVKRCDLNDPTKFPGNKNSYSGTTSQEVIKCLIERGRYVQKQKWCVENVIVIFSLRLALWFLEFRASRKHGRLYLKSLTFPETTQMCEVCGHTHCKHTK